MSAWDVVIVGARCAGAATALHLARKGVKVLIVDRALRLKYASDTLQTQAESLALAESRVMDADVAEETAALVREQILQRSGTAVLAQANQSPALALKLLV